MKSRLTVVVVLIAAVAACYWFITAPSQPNGFQRMPPMASEHHKEKPVSKVATISLAKPEAKTVDDVIEQISRLMQEKFSGNISNPLVQVGLKDLRSGLEADFPGQGADMFERIVRNAFPELADDILALIVAMDSYDEWLVDNYLDLNDMNAVAKESTIWNKRVELFGEETARAIWNEEVAQDLQRERNVKTVMTELDTAYDMPLADRVFTMQAAMQENYGMTAEGMVMGTASLTTQLVFRLDSVQRDLLAMEPEQRQESINQVRRQLGFAEERIPVLAEQDRLRDEMWSKGASYMQERDALVANYQGDDLETELDLLRLEHFDDRHAYSIKQEEALGMMRYQRKRVFGLN